MIADVHVLAGAYVLDAVDDRERAAFERHLDGCETCRGEVAGLRGTAARLADGAWSVPPPRLRAAVLAAVRRTRRLAPPTPVPAALRLGERTRRLVPGAPAPAARRRGEWRRLLAVAAAVVVAAAGAGTAVHRIQDQRVRDAQAAADAARAQQERIRDVLASRDVVVRSQELAGGGRVTVAYSRLRDTGVIMMAADAAPAGGRVFQLWTVRSAEPVDEGVLAVGQTSIVKVVDGMSSASDVGVTVEPAGGSRTPADPMAADLKIL